MSEFTLIDCSQVNSSPRGMALYSLDIANAVRDRADLLFVFRYSQSNINLFHKLNTKGKVIFVPLPQTFIEQFVVPLLILVYNVKIYVTAGDSVSLIGCRLTRTYLLLHDIYFRKKIELNTYSMKRRLGRIYRSFTVGNSISRCDKIISVSNFTKKQILHQFQSLNENKVHILPNQLRYEITKVDKTSKNLLMVTGSDPQKNAKWAIEAVLTSIIDFDKLFVIGVASHYDLGLASDPKVEYVGFLEQTELEKYYENCRVLLLPSLDESFGVPVIEAFSKNCQVCASRSGAIPEVGSNFAHYFELNDSSSFYDALHTAMSATHKWRKLVSHLKQFCGDELISKIRDTLS